MYRLLRNTHLFLGIGAFLFVLMYGFSAVQMAHNTWFSMKPTVKEMRVSVAPDISDDPRAIARELRNAGVRGELGDVQPTAAGYKFDVARPGTHYQVEYTRATREAKIQVSTAGFMGMLNRIHHLRGLGHDFGLINAWGVSVVLVSMALIVLGGTGIYLWFKIHCERVIGVALLAINLGVCVTLLVLIRTA
ncbi:MAG: hypothetical protein JWO48_3484 [Bryobacterales bacterium]|nr:hypothetical protein [Bryobacterales bacterium]